MPSGAQGGVGELSSPAVTFVPTGTKRRLQDRTYHYGIAVVVYKRALAKARVRGLTRYPCAVAPVLALVRVVFLRR